MKDLDNNVQTLDIEERQKIERSLYLQQKGEFDQAIELLHTVHAPENSRSSIYNNLGCLYFEKGSFEQAESYLKKAVALNDGNIESQINLADLYFYLKNYNSAFLIYDKIYRDQPTAEVIERLGDCLIGMDNMKEALIFYQQALNIQPDNRSVIKKIELITIANSPIPIRIDTPSMTKNTIAVVCYVPAASSENRLALNVEAFIKALTDLKTHGFAISIVGDSTNQLNSNDIENISAEKFFSLNNKFLFDIFISVNDIDIFEYDINAKAKVLFTNAIFDPSQQERIAVLANKTVIDYYLLSTNLNKKTLISAYQIPDDDIDYFDLHSDDQPVPIDWLKNYLHRCLLEMTQCHAEHYLLTNNPLKSIMLINDSILKLEDQTELKHLRQKIERQYPQLEDEALYKEIFENRARARQYNSHTDEHPCFIWLIEQLKKQKTALRLLDVGCHKGEFAIQLAKLGYHVTGVDISQFNVDCAEQHANENSLNEHHTKFIAGEAEKISQNVLPHNFSAILLFQILEHIRDYNAVLSEIEKIIEPDGMVYITVLANPAETVQRELLSITEPPQYLRTFTIKELEQLFSHNDNFKIEEIVSGNQKWYGVSFCIESPQCVVHSKKSEDIINDNIDQENFDIMFKDAVTYIHENKLKKAFAVLLNMLQINPEQPKILYNAAVLCDRMGERKAAIEVLTNVIDIDPQMPEPHNYLGKIYFQEGQYMPALEQFKTAISKDIENDELYTNYKLCADRLGLDLVDENSDIVFYTAGPIFNGNSNFQKGLGGSESALIYMSREFVRLGYNVRVFNNCDRPGYYDGVLYGDLPDFHIYRHFNRIRAFISLRSLKPFKIKLDADLKILWIQDNTNVLFLENERVKDLQHIDRIFAVSQWQIGDWGRHFKLSNDKFFTTRNGVDPSFTFTKPAVRNPYKLVYLSRPERGLKTLLQIFPEIKKELPEAELHVFSYCFQERNSEMTNYEAMMNQPGVVLRGSLSRQELLQELKTASLMVYPTSHLETSCTAAIEAQAAGVPVITSKLGALPETVITGKTGILISGDPSSKYYQTTFINAVLRLLRDNVEWQKFSEQAQQHAISYYNWRTIAEEWKQEIDNLQKRQRL